MNLLSFATHIASRGSLDLLKTIVNDQTYQDYIFASVNICRKYMNGRHPWPWRQKTFYLPTIPNYSAGTLAVANGSRNVAGNGTTFTSAMVGRYLKLNRDTEIYRIRSVTDGTNLVLETPYISDSGSSLTYFIWTKLYSLPPDVPHLEDINLSDYPLRSEPWPRKTLDSAIFAGYVIGAPHAWAWAGLDRTMSTYSTGTISISEDSKTLTGSGTAWLDNVLPGAKVTIGTIEYNTESVDSDTQITLVQKATSAQTNSTYSITMQNRSQIALCGVPSPAVNLQLTYFKRTYDLVNDVDDLEIWEPGELVLGNIVYAYLQEKLTSDKAFNWLATAEKQIAMLWQDLCNSEAVDTITVNYPTVPSNYRPGLYG